MPSSRDIQVIQVRVQLLSVGRLKSVVTTIFFKIYIIYKNNLNNLNTSVKLGNLPAETSIQVNDSNLNGT